VTPVAVAVFGILFLPYIVVTGILMWGGATAAVRACRRRPADVDLLDGLRPFHWESVGDEAERWLKTQR
jgi:hypothetical protein